MNPGHVNPFISLIYYVAALIFTCIFSHPAFAAAGLLVSVVTALIVGKKRAVLPALAFLITGIIFAFIYAGYNHFGETLLFDTGNGNPITIEALAKGSFLGCRISTILLFLYAFLKVFSWDKILYIAGSISPKLSVYLGMIIRFFPGLSHNYREIAAVKRVLGKNHFFKSIWAALLLTIEKTMISKESAVLRGINKPKRSFFKVYRFDKRDLRLGCLLAIAIVSLSMCCFNGIGYASYSPRLSFVSYEDSTKKEAPKAEEASDNPGTEKNEPQAELTEKEEVTEQKIEEPVTEDNKTEAEISEVKEENTTSNVQKEAEINTCTISISCKTILNNMESIAPEKQAYVPANGVIMGSYEAAITGEESVFDILVMACKEKGIHLEYSYTPAFSSSYVEGIAQIYEFDCGPQSGWMYRVNGTAPGVGASSYIVSPGDRIEFVYTCNGLGADL